LKHKENSPASEDALVINKTNFSWGIKSEETKDSKTDSSSKKDVEQEKDKPADTKTVSIDSLVVLKDIDLKVKKGEFVCIIGDVGSGKSSILSAIIGDLIPVSQA
jgi:ABC-type polysaccharide/polyol phosphate transport system ATPase subunit